MALADRMVDEMLRLEDEHRPKVSAVIAEGMDFGLSAFHQNRNAALITEAFKRSVVQALTDLHDSAIQAFAGLMLREFAEGFKEMKQEDEVRRLLFRYIDRYGARSAAQILDTTERQVRNLMLGGLRRGQAVDAVYADLVNKVPEIADGRAAVITPTEVHAASQFASQAVAERSGILLKKTWVSVNDERTRDFFGYVDEFNHRVMNGQKVALDGQFAVPNKWGGVELISFPGDPNGSAGNIINCRCVQVYERA